MFKLNALPGIQGLEDHALLRGIDDPGEGENPGFALRLASVCVKLFGVAVMGDKSGITLLHGSIEADDEGGIEEEEGEEDPLENLRCLEWTMDDDIAAHLLTLGWDLYDDRGQPLRITKPIAPTLEAVALGLEGHIPDSDALEAERFGNSFGAAAEKWRADKRRNR